MQQLKRKLPQRNRKKNQNIGNQNILLFLPFLLGKLPIYMVLQPNKYNLIDLTNGIGVAQRL